MCYWNLHISKYEKENLLGFSDKICWFYFQGMEAAGFAKTVTHTYHNTSCHIPENSRVHSHDYKNLNYHHNFNNCSNHSNVSLSLYNICETYQQLTASITSTESILVGSYLNLQSLEDTFKHCTRTSMLRTKHTILKLTSSASLLSKIRHRLLCLLLSISNRKLEKALSSKQQILITSELVWTTFLLPRTGDMLIYFLFLIS